MIQTGLLHIIGSDVIPRTCTSCELSYVSKLQSNCMPGLGCKGAIMFVGKHPGKEDDGIGQPMTGKNGRLFYSLLLDAGFSRDEVFVTNCVKCAPIAGNAGKRNWVACQQHFLAELASVQPKIIVAVGAEATEFLTGKKGVSSLRATGLSLELDDKYTVYPIRQPMMIEHAQTAADQVALRESMIEDLRRIRNIYHGGGTVNVDSVKEETDYQIAYSHEDVLRFFAELRSHVGPLVCDLETVNNELTDGVFHPDDGQIQAIGFSTKSGMGRAIPLHARGIDTPFWWPDGYLQDTLIPMIQAFLRERNQDIYGHNWCKFDVKWTRAKWNVDFPSQKFDTLHAAYAALHGLRSYELEVLANSLCGMKRWKKEFTVQDTVAGCIYLCKDVDATVRIRAKIEEQMDENERVLLEEILMPWNYELMLMEEMGATIDLEALEDVGKLLDSKLGPLMEKITQRAEVREWSYEQGQKFEGRDEQMRSLLFDHMKVKGIKKTGGGDKWSVDASVMEALAEDVPVCADVVLYRRIEKLRSTYYEGTKKHLRGTQIHTSYGSHKTVSGRLASTDPNLQTIPRSDTVQDAGFTKQEATMMKDIFVAHDGFTLIERDQSQVELRVIASLSGCVRMIQMYLDDQDVHQATAAAVYGIAIDMVSEAQRTNAKSVNFGIIYGMSKQGLIAKFEAAESTAQDALEFLKMHKIMFPEIWEFMAQQEQLVLRDGQQTTYFGRTRVYEDKSSAVMRQAYNQPVQSHASDITSLSMIRAGREMRRRKMRSRMMLTVHDSIVFKAWIDEFWEVMDVSTVAMENLEFPWLKVPLKSDAKAGPRWGSMFKVDLKKRELIPKK